MDGLVSILLFAFLIIVSSARKNNAQKRKTQPINRKPVKRSVRPQPHIPAQPASRPAAPYIPPLQTTESYSTDSAQYPEPETEYFESIESESLEIIEPMPSEQLHDTATSATVDNHAEEQGREHDCSSVFDFDIRRAVIEAEILAPKFKEF